MGSPEFERARREATLDPAIVKELERLFDPADCACFFADVRANKVFAVRDFVRQEAAMETDGRRKLLLEALLVRIELQCPKRSDFWRSESYQGEIAA